MEKGDFTVNELLHIVHLKPVSALSLLRYVQWPYIVHWSNRLVNHILTKHLDRIFKLVELPECDDEELPDLVSLFLAGRLDVV